MSEKRRRGRPRDESVDAAVMEATLAEITERGLSAATVEAIALRAGVARATLYRRWSSKEELLRFLASRVFAEYEPIDTGDLRKDLLAVFEPIVDQLREGAPVAVLMPILVGAAAHDGQIREFVASMAAERQAGAVDALRRAERRGELRPGVDIETVVDMVAGAFTHRLLLAGGGVGNAYVRQVVDEAIGGILQT